MSQSFSSQLSLPEDDDTKYEIIDTVLAVIQTGYDIYNLWTQGDKDLGNVKFADLPDTEKLKASLGESVILNKPEIADKDKDKRIESATIFYGEFRIVAITMFQNILILLRIGEWKVRGNGFARSIQLPSFSSVPDEHIEGVYNAIIDETFGAEDATLQDQWKGFSTELLKATTSQELVLVLLTANRAFNARALQNAEKHAGTKPTGSTATATSQKTSRGFFKLGYGEGDRIILSWNAVHGKDLLRALISIGDCMREMDQKPGFCAFLAFNIGQYLLSEGQNPFDAYRSRSLGTVGFRKSAQTYVSLTDPAEGHIYATTRKLAWMEGAIVHVEYLERPSGTKGAEIESYRMPSILDFARVCLHTGYAAPNTIFIGRALKDYGTFEFDFIKVVNTCASAATAAFQLGAAECKISMSGFRSSKDMVTYMRALSGHTLKNYRQYFSAAFNLKSKFLDDLFDRPQPIECARPMDIALRAIEIAAIGGFDKVTWDGAGDDYPSTSIMEQLEFPQLLELVHRAHCAGLPTYFSAGLKFLHIPEAVYTGVDRILRIMDRDTGMHGPYTEENIVKIIQIRNDAAKTPRGRAAVLLARLDHMYFEGSISKMENELRVQIYDLLKVSSSLAQQRWPATKKILEEQGNIPGGEEEVKTSEEKAHDKQICDILDSPLSKTVMQLPGDLEEPWTGRARRLLRTFNAPDIGPLLKVYGASPDGGANVQSVNANGRWEQFVKQLNDIIKSDSNAEGQIHSYSLSQRWSDIRDQYRKNLPECKEDPKPKYFASDIQATLKITPPEIVKISVLSSLKAEIAKAENLDEAYRILESSRLANNANSSG